MNEYTQFNRRVTVGFFLYLAVLVSAFIVYLFQDYTLRMNSYVCDTKQHTVSYGESLWEIAESNCSGSIRSAVDDLVDIYGSDIQNGQVIDLPTK
jgi:hypothetical protein